MANFTPSKKTAQDFNDGEKYIGYNPTTQELGDYVEAETVNNLVESALYSQQEADSAKQTAQAAKDLIEATIQGQSIPPAIGLHHIQFYGEPTPAEIWAGTTWEIDTYYQGRTIIGSSAGGITYPFGATGGSADAVVVEHGHNLMLWDFNGDTATDGFQYGMNFQTNSGIYREHYNEGNVRGIAKAVGESGTGKNMQPYVVVNYWKRTA